MMFVIKMQASAKRRPVFIEGSVWVVVGIRWERRGVSIDIAIYRATSIGAKASVNIMCLLWRSVSIMVVLRLLLSKHFAIDSNLTDMLLLRMEKLFKFGYQTLKQQVLHWKENLWNETKNYGQLPGKVSSIC